jgi:hypothetical protein
VKSLKTLTTFAKMRLVLMCTAPGCDQGQGIPYKTPHMPSGDAQTLLRIHRARRHPPAPELAKEQALQVNTNMDTMVRLYKLECTFPTCYRGDGAHYKTLKLASGLALALLQEHRAERHPPAASPNAQPPANAYTTVTDSLELPFVPSTIDEDSYGLLSTKPLPE